MGKEPKKTGSSLIQVIKNLWYREGEKAKAKKKEKINRPKGIVARKFGVAIFWVLFAFMLMVVFTTVFSGSDAADAESSKQVEKENKATSQEAVQYAKNFTATYFSWKQGDEGLSKRREALVNYLAKGLDEDGGLSTTDLNYGSTFNNAEVVDVKSDGDNRAYITLKVDATFSRTWQEEETKKVKKGKKEKEEKVKVDKSEDKPFSKYFVVPVAYQNNTFGVYDLPKYTNVKTKTEVQMTEPTDLKEYTGQSAKVKDFVNTFFKSFAEDSADKLDYMLAGGADVQGLEGAMVFEDVSEAKIKSDDSGDIIVLAKVNLRDKDTDVKFTTTYQLTIERENDRYLVKSLNDYSNQKEVSANQSKQN
ncbi:conjugal transfer protein [Bacillus subtilis]|uniref:conjugal transfer protein n=1 Tax=Bacillus subtilis TaxID=1423 RepID=UPI002041E586|nr:conjugal transfer protein [Bacillus subtilis]MCM3191397.1 conjugal transfer protein [Bacillus subtilis]